MTSKVKLDETNKTVKIGSYFDSEEEFKAQFNQYLSTTRQHGRRREVQDSLFIVKNPCGSFESAYAETFKVALALYFQQKEPLHMKEIDYDQVRFNQL